MQAISYENGRTAARNAAFHARKLSIPNGVAIFANIGNFFEADAGWITGWVESLIPSGYRAGIYNDPEKGPFPEAYCQAVKQNKEIAVQSILWSAEPETGISTARKAPAYLPAHPNCKSNVWIWKYGRDAKKCSINTNLCDERLLAYLF